MKSFYAFEFFLGKSSFIKKFLDIISVCAGLKFGFGNYFFLLCTGFFEYFLSSDFSFVLLFY